MTTSTAAREVVIAHTHGQGKACRKHFLSYPVSKIAILQVSTFWMPEVSPGQCTRNMEKETVSRFYRDLIGSSVSTFPSLTWTLFPKKTKYIWDKEREMTSQMHVNLSHFKFTFFTDIHMYRYHLLIKKLMFHHHYFAIWSLSKPPQCNSEQPPRLQSCMRGQLPTAPHFLFLLSMKPCISLLPSVTQRSEQWAPSAACWALTVPRCMETTCVWGACREGGRGRRSSWSVLSTDSNLWLQAEISRGKTKRGLPPSKLNATQPLNINTL